ncbi:MAG: sulfatase [Lentisphaerae bacterium]|nr:sulfatase [Lentisphaerota bacterium]
MKRTAILLAVSLLAAPAARAATPPNVLVILTDDQRWDAMSIAGHPHLETPNIDRIGREGVHFRNAFCTTSLCSPSRASLLSGLYAHGHGVVNNFTDYPHALASFPRALQAAGYATAYIGKWHMGENDDSPRPGFDWFVTHKGQGKYWDTEFNLNGAGGRVVTGYYTRVVTDLALEWLDRPRGDKPWMLILGHKAPHSYYTPEPRFSNAFANVAVPYPDSAFHLEGKPDWVRQRMPTWHGIHGPLFDWRKKFPDASPEAVKDFEAMTRAYWATLLSVDESVGRLLAALERRGELDRTVVVFLGDNGLLNGEHGMVDKRTAHEPSLRIPLLVRYPGLLPPARAKAVDAQVLTVDLAPSLLELCGAPPLPGIHGRSWVSLVRGGDPAWRTSWFYEYNYEKQFPYTPNVRALRTDRWKYIRYPHGDGGPDRHTAELYDLAADPEERRNLAADPARAATVAALRAELETRMRETALDPARDPMPVDEGIGTALPDAKLR